MVEELGDRMDVMEITGVCLTLYGPMDCNLLGSSVHGIFQARILEWVALSFSKESWNGLPFPFPMQESEK